MMMMKMKMIRQICYNPRTFTITNHAQMLKIQEVHYAAIARRRRRRSPASYEEALFDVLPDPETMSKWGREGGGMFFLSFTLDSFLCLSEKLVFGGRGGGCSCCKVSPQQLQTPAREDDSSGSQLDILVWLEQQMPCAAWSRKHTGSVHTPIDVLIVAGEHALSGDERLPLAAEEASTPEEELFKETSQWALLFSGHRHASVTLFSWWSVVITMMSWNCSSSAADVKPWQDEEESGRHTKQFSSLFLVLFLVPPNMRYRAVAEIATAATIVSFFVSSAGSIWMLLTALLIISFSESAAFKPADIVSTEIWSSQFYLFPCFFFTQVSRGIETKEKAKNVDRSPSESLIFGTREQNVRRSHQKHSPRIILRCQAWGKKKHSTNSWIHSRVASFLQAFANRERLPEQNTSFTWWDTKKKQKLHLKRSCSKKTEENQRI